EELGGPATPAIGFAMGMERLAMLLPDIAAGSVDVAVVAIGDSVAAYALGIA
ncbi:MAG TPA: histidine--tRNA ligase, partial [Zetaproteobacteria bacterium]|nr:histidine--tRNA ligase [Zetaproteobacteria bacterium]